MAMQMIVPVTPQLREALEASMSVLTHIDKNSSPSGPNDREDFRPVVDELEVLIVSTLTAASSVLPTARNHEPSSRFDMGSGTPLADCISQVVEYLRDVASDLLDTGHFSRYESDNLAKAYAMLSRLCGLILSGVVKQAEADLRVVRSKRIADFLTAADALAKAAKG